MAPPTRPTTHLAKASLKNTHLTPYLDLIRRALPKERLNPADMYSPDITFAQRRKIDEISSKIWSLELELRALWPDFPREVEHSLLSVKKEQTDVLSKIPAGEYTMIVLSCWREGEVDGLEVGVDDMVYIKSEKEVPTIGLFEAVTFQNWDLAGDASSEGDAGGAAAAAERVDEGDAEGADEGADDGDAEGVIRLLLSSLQDSGQK